MLAIVEVLLKRFTGALLVGIMALSLASCSSAGASSGSSAATSNNGSASQDASSDESADATETINIYYQTWNPNQDQFPDCQAEFEELNPDIKIQFTRITYSDHLQKLKIDLASGQGPDVYSLQAGASIKEFRDFEMDLTDYAIKEWGGNWRDKFLPFATELIEEDGKFFGMPMGTTYAGMIWLDMTYFDKYNIPAPTSYDELKAATDTLRQNGELPLVIGSMDNYINQDIFMGIANDVSSEKIYAAIEGQIAFTEPEIVEALRIWQSLFTEGIFQDGAVGLSMVDAINMFEREGIAPMYCTGSWGIGSYSPFRQDPELRAIFLEGEREHQVALIDWNNNGEVSPVVATVENVLCMNANTPNPEAAWKFISYMATGGQDILVNRYMQCFTSRTDSTATLEVDLPVDGKVCRDKIIDWGTNNVGGYREIPYPELKLVICDNLKALGIGSVTPEQAAETIEAASQAQTR